MGALSLRDVIEELHRIFSVNTVNVDEVRQLLSSYKSNPADWQQYALFDEHRYTRNLVDKGNTRFNCMILCWGPSMGSSVHDHADAHCFVKMLQGSLRETQYAWPTKPADGEALEALTATGTCDYEKDGVTYINDSIGLHRMENASHTETAISLHIYIPPFAKCHTFDERTGKKSTVRFTFWSVGGERLDRQARLDTCKQLALRQVSNAAMESCTDLRSEGAPSECALVDPRLCKATQVKEETK